MHPLATKAIIESVRRRVDQGDCPTEPAHSRETLEDALLTVSADLTEARASLSRVEEKAAWWEAECRDTLRALIPLGIDAMGEVVDLSLKLREQAGRRGPPVAHDGEATPTEIAEPVRVMPENYWREVWHEHCPKRGPMKRMPETLTIEDGSVLDHYECLGCGAHCFAGLDAGRFVITRRYEALSASPVSTPEER